jgi:hypothetical protein
MQQIALPSVEHQYHPEYISWVGIMGLGPVMGRSIEALLYE